MAVIATLVVGADGATLKAGSSMGVTSAADRARYLTNRKLADCILIGGNTARSEPYLKTPVPLVVVSRGDINPLVANPRVHLWNLSPVLALDKAIATFGPRINIEGGASLIMELIAARRIDVLELSITTAIGGEKPIDIEDVLHNFSTISESIVDQTRLITASQPLKN